MSPIDPETVVLTCVGGADGRRRPHGIRRPGRRTPVDDVSTVFAAVPSITLGARPGRDEVDPVLRDRPGRVVVCGTDADLAAVVVRLLRTELLDAIEVAYVPDDPRSAAAVAWGLPTRPRAAAELARHGRAGSVPLVRDDAGGVLVGRGEIPDLEGEAYCDAVRVLRGRVRRLAVDAGPDGIAVRSARGVRAATGRAVQVGCTGARVRHDGVEHPREVTRWAWYRHTEPWRLVRP